MLEHTRPAASRECANGMRALSVIDEEGGVRQRWILERLGIRQGQETLLVPRGHRHYVQGKPQ